MKKRAMIKLMKIRRCTGTFCLVARIVSDASFLDLTRKSPFVVRPLPFAHRLCQFDQPEDVSSHVAADQRLIYACAGLIFCDIRRGRSKLVCGLSSLNHSKAAEIEKRLCRKIHFQENLPLCGATTDENDRPPLDKGGLQGGGVWKFRKPPPGPLLVQGGATSFSEEPFMPLCGATTDENLTPSDLFCFILFLLNNRAIFKGVLHAAARRHDR